MKMLTEFWPGVQLDDVAKARPEITKAVENMVSKGKWTVPGYTESEYKLPVAILLRILLTVWMVTRVPICRVRSK
jgi:hypothetical protein